jgi:superfamily II DNA or RNA helicase
MNDNNTIDDDILSYYFNRVLSYPKQTAKNFQLQIYKKKELNKFRIKHLPEFTDIEKIKEYIKNKCLNKIIKLSNHQNMLRNYLTPDSPYSGLLLFHGLGLGKTCAAINIAEGFKKQVEKYQTKIYIIVPGPTLKMEWKTQLYKCTGNTYINANNNNKLYGNDKNENLINQYYKIISKNSFLKRTLGERVKNDDENDKQKKGKKYKKDSAGEILRTEHVNKLENLNNTLLIIDEAHGLTDNDYSKAVQYIVKKSKNLKVLLLTGTPMKNLASDIVDLLNLIRPADQKINKSDIFDSSSGNVADLKFTENGKEKLIEACRGYVSYMNNNDYLLFAEKKDMGELTENLKFTPIIPCLMSDFQKNLYDSLSEDFDKLDKASTDATNFSFPIIDNNSDTIIPKSGFKGKNELINQLYRDPKHLNESISKLLKLKKPNYELVMQNEENNKYFYGDILTSKYLSFFSSKYGECLKHIENLINENAKPAFIYSNSVEIGINLFKYILKYNGYLEFEENSETTNAKITNKTKCYKCGICYKDHENKDHDFKPAVFYAIVGKVGFDDGTEEKDKEIIEKYFNSSDNFDGKIIKIVMGSKVISEGYNIFNLREVHILDTYYNIARVEQVIGRAIRKCSHAVSENQINRDPFPVVKVYRYCTVSESLGTKGRKPTIDEILYVKAEKKHILIKQVERILKENAIDCPILYNNNKYGKRYDKYKDCIPLKVAEEYDIQEIKDKSKICPVQCDYMKCDYKCNCDELNNLYFDEKEKEYKEVDKKDLDTSTFTEDLFFDEIQQCKNIIKYMYFKKYVYVLDDFIKEIKKYSNDFDIYILYKVLDNYIINDDSEIINYSDSEYIIDKYNRPGYLIYVNKFYVFQPLWTPINQTISERENYYYNINLNVSLKDYLSYNNLLTNYNNSNTIQKTEYDFETGKSYYTEKKEYDFVGIIDKEPNKKKSKIEINDIFKLRKKLTKTNSKKRQVGLQSYSGSVCFNSYTIDELLKLSKKLGVKNQKYKNRSDICKNIKDVMYDLEKYTTDNITYMIIPYNHPSIPFPLNIHDRVNMLKKDLKKNFENSTLVIDKQDIVEKIPHKYNINIQIKDNIEELRNYLILHKFNIIKETKNNINIEIK